MLNYWKTDYGLHMHAISMRESISIEEAALKTTLEYMKELVENVDNQQRLLKGYERQSDVRLRKEIIMIPKTGKKIVIPSYPPKNKTKHDLFLQFYKAAKKDLKEKGEITKETLKIIEDAKPE